MVRWHSPRIEGTSISEGAIIVLSDVITCCRPSGAVIWHMQEIYLET